MKNYIDLWVKNIDIEMIRVLDKLGYIAIAVESLPDNLDRDSNKYSIHIVEKKIIEASSKKELREKLYNIKKKPCIVSAKPLSKEVARMAGHDSRVDTIIIDADTVKYIDRNQINLMKEYSKPLELPINIWFSTPYRIRSMIYRRINYYLLRTSLPLIISSSASKWNEIMIPRSIITYMALSFGMSREELIASLTTYPREILVKNGVSI